MTTHNVPSKTCDTCGRAQPLAAFPPCHLGGFAPTCNACDGLTAKEEAEREYLQAMESFARWCNACGTNFRVGMREAVTQYMARAGA